MKTIDQQWQGFSAMVFSRTKPSQTQIDEMKKAFFAGAWSLFCAIEEIGMDHVSEQEGEAFLESWREECIKFKNDLIREYSETN